MNTQRCLIAALGAACLLLGACTPPAVMLTNSMGSDRTIQYVVQQSGSAGEDEALYNLYVRVCPLAQDGSQDEAECKKSLAIENVVVAP